MKIINICFFGGGYAASYFVLIATLAALTGQHVVRKIIAIFGRASIIIFVLAFTIFLSAISLGTLHDFNLKFQHFVPCILSFVDWFLKLTYFIYSFWVSQVEWELRTWLRRWKIMSIWGLQIYAINLRSVLPFVEKWKFFIDDIFQTGDVITYLYL